MALPIWISGFTGSAPDALAFLINGSPDCCPELSVCFDEWEKWLPDHDKWDTPGAADNEDYQILGRKKFWQTLGHSQDPEYQALAHEFDEAIKLSQILKNDTRMIGLRENYDLYAEKCALLPPRQKYHGMQIRTANLDDAVTWIPGSKAVWATTWFINDPTIIWNWTDMAVRANIDNGLGKVLAEIEIQDMSDWPPESGNSSNGYISQETVDKVSFSFGKHIFANFELWIKLKEHGIHFFPQEQFLNIEHTMTIYDELEIARPDTAWVERWVSEFRRRLNLDMSYCAELDVINQQAEQHFLKRLELSQDLTDDQKQQILQKQQQCKQSFS